MTHNDFNGHARWLQRSVSAVLISAVISVLQQWRCKQTHVAIACPLKRRAHLPLTDPFPCNHLACLHNPSLSLAGPRGASPTPAAAAEPAAAPGGGKRPPMGAASLIRLGTLMAVTMTLHNLPEGFAVAFSAFTPLGPIMALAIAAHNIPEGIIVAAPIYAATGSRWKAMGMATASVRLLELS